MLFSKSLTIALISSGSGFATGEGDEAVVLEVDRVDGEGLGLEELREEGDSRAAWGSGLVSWWLGLGVLRR